MQPSARVLFVDRDGTLIREPRDTCQVDSLEKLDLIPGVIIALHRIRSATDFRFVMVTNQDGLGTGTFPLPDFQRVQDKMLSLFGSQGIEFQDILIDDSNPREARDTRKPGTGLLRDYPPAKKFRFRDSWVIGDRISDMHFARNLGCRGIWLQPPTRRNRRRLQRNFLTGTCGLVTSSWERVADHLTGIGLRKAEVQRFTRETRIRCCLTLDGRGKYRIRTGLGFLDHMLEQFCFHGRFDLRLKVRGDLEVDTHHTVEDTGLVLGEAFSKALGESRGINRYGFLLPMDDSLAEVAVDLSGRPYLDWKVTCTHSMIGGIPSGMFRHFFRSFVARAGLNLHVRVQGEDDHHRIESIFKGVGRTLKMAVSRETGVYRSFSTRGDRQ